MRKIFFTLCILISVTFGYAQCTPDPQFSSAGIYPDSASGLVPAYVGQAYNQNITIITPLDTTVEYLGQIVNVTIDNIDLTNVSGLPASFSYACDPPSCSFPGGTIKCAELYSTAPLSSEIGLHQIIFETTTYVSNVPFIGTTTQDDVIDYYYLEVSAPSATINQFDKNTFELKLAYPNPVMQQAKIQFILGAPLDITFNVYSLLGEKIDSKYITASRGVNTIQLNTMSYSPGIYLFSINNGEKILTQRMIVEN